MGLANVSLLHKYVPYNRKLCSSCWFLIHKRINDLFCSVAISLQLWIMDIVLMESHNFNRKLIMAKVVKRLGVLSRIALKVLDSSTKLSQIHQLFTSGVEFFWHQHYREISSSSQFEFAKHCWIWCLCRWVLWTLWRSWRHCWVGWFIWRCCCRCGKFLSCQQLRW